MKKSGTCAEKKEIRSNVIKKNLIAKDFKTETK